MKEIPIAKPSLGRAEAQAAADTVLSGWVTQGPRVKAFEDAFASAVGSQHACAVSSCTVALHLALLAVGVKPGDVVITVSHSFIATANAVRHCGAEPVFVDIDADTLNMDPAALERCLREDFDDKGRVAAILVVHQVGMPANLEPILRLASERSIPVVEDAACAIGAEFRGERIGKPHGDIACFSFHPRKVITTGDGGMLTTNDAALDAKFRLLRHHGMDVSDYARHSSDDVIFERYAVTGFNYRMTDIQAAVGLEQLKRLPELIKERRELARMYAEALASTGVQIPREPEYARSNWQSYIVRLAPGQDQRRTMQALKARGIHTRRGIMCAHLETPYAAAWPKGCLPRSEEAQERGLTLPLYPGMERADVARVVEALRAAA